MAKGILRGFVTGLVIGGVGAGAYSLLSDPPQGAVQGATQGTPPKASPVEVPAGSDFEGKREDREPVLPKSEDAPLPGAAPKIETPPETAETAETPVDEDSRQPAAKPETGGPENTLTPPPEDTPAEDGKISTDPAQPAAPAAPEDKAFPENTPETAQDPETAPESPVDASPAAEQNEPPAPPKRAAPLPSVTDETPKQDRPGIGTPAGRLTDKDDPEPQTDTAQPAPQPPIVANAAEFENPEAKPLMSIVLLDDGQSDMALEALAAFPYALTYAVDALAPNAAERMAAYRAAGVEVMALVNLPAGSTASDTETLLRGALERMPQTVAVMEGDDSGLQTDKAVSDQVSAILAETGHGLVLFPKGLNTAQKLATKEGVPAATVFRDFDAKDQSAQIIRRFLDQAAFKARQEENGVIMVGRLRPDTISALLLWGLQGHAATVALAPISALLRAAQN